MQTQTIYKLICTAILLCLTPFATAETLRLITTTSVKGSGLADTLIPIFEKDTQINVIFSVAGTGKVLRLGRDGKADIIWVHAPDAEKKYIKEGNATQRITVMFNDFLIVGPTSDPTDICRGNSVTAALKEIEAKKQIFVSRGDDSGTHKKEISLWEAADIDPFGTWYYQSGTGMTKSLYKANELGAYTMIDRGTWLKNRKKVTLQACLEGDELLLNYYSLLPINPARHNNINTAAAEKFIAFITSNKVQKIIANYKIDGEQLFHLHK